MNRITPAQCRAARALLEWTRDDLSAHSEVSKSSLIDFERGTRSPYNRTLAAVQQALEDAGIEFIPQNGGGPGVRFRDRL